MWTTIICLIIIIITIFIIINRKKKFSTKKSTPKTTSTTATTPPPISKVVSPKKPRSINKTLSGILLGLLVIGIALLIFWFGLWIIPKGIKGFRNFFNPPTQSSRNYTPSPTYVDVYFTGEYGQTIHLPRGTNFGFRDADQPYCVMDGNGNEYKADKGGDASNDITPYEEGNLKLKFKSQNGQSGHLRIKLYKGKLKR